MAQSLHDFVVDRLMRAKGKWPLIAAATGISKRTIEKIASREIKDPSVSSIEKLAHHFRHHERRPDSRPAATGGP